MVIFRSGVQQACPERHLRAVTVREIAGIPRSLPPNRTSCAWLWVHTSSANDTLGTNDFIGIHSISLECVKSVALPHEPRRGRWVDGVV
jgi:hypothetical protein